MKFILTIIVFIFAIHTYAQNFSNGFTFNMPYDDSTAQFFLPQFQKNSIGYNDIITKDNSGNFLRNGEPIKFWGTNLVAGGAFLSKEEAPKVAAIMRKMGFNLIRFHHIDNNWSHESLFYNFPTISTTVYNESYFDLLLNTIAELKKQGIYVDMNLHVSRTFTIQDGVLEADSIIAMGTEFYKGVTLFDPFLMKLQKQYAKDLLTRVNPYTGLSLAQDPVLAMVEIVNENSLFRNWKNDELRHFNNGGKLCWRHNQMLDSMFIAFLAEKYITTENIANAWNEGSFESNVNLIPDGEFESDLALNNWVFELHEGAEATLEMDTDAYQGNGCARISSNNAGTENWHLQFEYLGFPLHPDSTYTLSFIAKADSLREINVNIMNHLSPYNSYGNKDFTVTTNWQEFSFSISPNELNETNTRLSFSFLTIPGTIWLDNVSLKYTSRIGLEENESIENKSIKRILHKDRYNYTDSRLFDLMQFYEKLQFHFFAEMKSYLKDSLGVRAMLSGTNWYIGPEDLKVQASLDYIDNHAYWNHPNFYNEPWDANDWRITNDPMVKSTDHNTIRNLFMGFFVKDMPFTISEYNHAFPNQYQSEMLPMITAYSSFHKADALMFFPYGSSEKHNFIDGFFNINRNALIMSGSPIYAYAFRNNFIAEATSSIHLNYTDTAVLTSSKQGYDSWTPVFEYGENLCYEENIIIDNFTAPEKTALEAVPLSNTGEFVTSTQEIYWNIENGIFTVDAEKFKSISGFLEKSPSLGTGTMAVSNSTNFGTVAWMSLTNNSLETTSTSVLNITSRVINTGMLWDENDQTVHNSWGTSPTLHEPVKLSLKIKTNAKVLKVIRMNEVGYANTSTYRAYWPNKDGIATIEIDQSKDKTLWYGIQNLQDDTGIVPSTEDGLVNISGSTMNVYPKIGNGNITVTFEDVLPKDATLEVIDALGRVIQSYPVSNSSNDLYIFIQTSGIYVIRYTDKNGNMIVEEVVVR